MSEEYGFTLCRSPNAKVSSGPRVKGKAHEVSIPLKCPPGSKLIGLHHLHPGGSLSLSALDKRTAKEHRLEVMCVKGRGRTRCYRFRPWK